MNFKIVNEENLLLIEQITEHLNVMESSNILDGVKLSQILIKHRSTQHSAASMLLLSDGHHNAGDIINALMFDNYYSAAGAEYTLHTFEYGDDHDSTLMQTMTERKYGN